MTERREEIINRKDIMRKIESLDVKFDKHLDTHTDVMVKISEGFARNDALGEAINRRLDTLNGKVAEHERIIKSQEIRDAVQADRLSNLQKDNEDGKWLSKQTRGQGVQIVFDLIKMGLVALIVFWLAGR